MTRSVTASRSFRFLADDDLVSGMQIALDDLV